MPGRKERPFSKGVGEWAKKKMIAFNVLACLGGRRRKGDGTVQAAGICLRRADSEDYS